VVSEPTGQLAKSPKKALLLLKDFIVIGRFSRFTVLSSNPCYGYYKVY
jgi:hypothetical protein